MAVVEVEGEGPEGGGEGGEGVAEAGQGVLAEAGRVQAGELGVDELGEEEPLEGGGLLEGEGRPEVGAGVGHLLPRHRGHLRRAKATMRAPWWLYFVCVCVGVGGGKGNLKLLSLFSVNS